MGSLNMLKSVNNNEERRTDPLMNQLLSSHFTVVYALHGKRICYHAYAAINQLSPGVIRSYVNKQNMALPSTFRSNRGS